MHPLMFLGRTLKIRLARSWLVMAVLLGVVSAFLFWAYQYAMTHNFSPDVLVRDSDYVTNVPFYVGSISMLGVILWTSSASCCFIGASLVDRKSRQFWFLVTAGIITAQLTLDDAFQFHQVIFPEYFHIHEGVLYLIYIACILAFLLYFLQDILKHTDYPILSAALIFMFLSVLPAHILDLNFIEDSLKFLGIVYWLAYFSRTAVHMVREKVDPA